ARCRFSAEDGSPTVRCQGNGASHVSSRYRRLSRPDTRNRIARALIPSQQRGPWLLGTNPAADRAEGPGTAGRPGPIGRTPVANINRTRGDDLLLFWHGVRPTLATNVSFPLRC